MKASTKKIAFILIPHFMAEGEEMRSITKKEGHLAESIQESILQGTPVESTHIRIASIDRIKSTPPMSTAGEDDNEASNATPKGTPVESTPIRVASVDRIKSTPPLTTSGEDTRRATLRNTPEVTVPETSSMGPFVKARENHPVTNLENYTKYTHLQLASDIEAKSEPPCITRVKIGGAPAGAGVREKAIAPGAPYAKAKASAPETSFSKAEALPQRTLFSKAEALPQRTLFSKAEAQALKVQESSTASAGQENLPLASSTLIQVKAPESRTKCVPLIIASGTQPKSVVLDYSRELEHTPIKKGQYIKDIAPFTEGAKIIPIDHEYIDELNRKVIGYLRNFSPIIENPSPGSYYIDLTGTRRLFGREIDTCGRVIRGLKALGFTARCGVGSTTLVARLASEVAGDCAVYEVFEPSENLFITPLSITLLPDLPLPVQNELQEDFNIRKIGELLGFSKNDLRSLFGKTGELLYEYSRGRARSTLNEKKTEESLRWECVVNSESNDNRALRRRFFDMIVELCATLRREHRVPRRAELTVVYRDNYLYITGGRLSHPSFFEEELYRKLVFYLNRALQRRTSVKKFILCLSRFTTPSLQLELFENALKPTELSRACDLIRERYGSKAIAYGG